MAAKRTKPRTRSMRQVRFLLSKRSPLTGETKARLRVDLQSGKVKVKRTESFGV